MKVDKRTFIIVVIILVIALPIIFFIFRKTFIPIAISMKETFTSAALTNSSTGIAPAIMNIFK